MTVEHHINFVGSNGDEAVELHRCTVMADTFEDAVNQALADAVEKGIDCSTLRAIGVEIVLPMSQEQRDLIAMARAAYLAHLEGRSTLDASGPLMH